MSVWTSWAIVIAKPNPELLEEILALPGVTEGRDLPLYRGSLDEFSNEYHEPFSVHRFGRFIRVGGDA